MSWPLGKVSDIGNVISGFAFKSEWFGEGEAKVIRIGDLQDGRVNIEDAETFNEESHKVKDQFKIRSGDILMALSGATVGKIAVADASVEGAYLNQRVAVIRGKAPEGAEYLKYIFSGNPLKKLLMNAGGAAQPNLSPKDLAGMEIFLPPLPAQKRIAAILDKADTIRRKRQQAIQLADEFLRAVFLDMFGDPVTNPKGWAVKKLNEISTKIFSGSTPVGGKEAYVEEGVTFLRSQNVWKRKILLDDVAYIDEPTHKKMKKSSLKNGDILMTKTGRFNTENSSLGRAAMFVGKDDSANINGHVYLIRLMNGVVSEFVLYILTTNEYRDYIRNVCVGGIDKRQINKEHLEEFPIIFPDFEKQKEFSRVMAIVDKHKELAVKGLEKSENIFNSLSKKAFSGKL